MAAGNQLAPTVYLRSRLPTNPLRSVSCGPLLHAGGAKVVKSPFSDD
jgi:hypothetical protein